MKIKFQPTNIEIRFEVCVLIYFFFGFIIYQIPTIFEACVKDGKTFSSEYIFALVILPTFFITANLLFLLFFKKHVILRAALAAVSGIVMAIAKFLQAGGIIDPVYFFLLSATCGIILGLYKGAYLEEESNKINNFNEVTRKLIDYLRDSYKYLLGRLFQGWLALGASLGVSMSILFKGGYDDQHLKFMALKMLTGFACISLAAGYWIAVPLVNGMLTIQEKMQSLESQRA